MGRFAEGWARLQRRFGVAVSRQAPPDESLGPPRPGETRPPWIEYPGFGPGDYFWREAGQPWKTLVWEPFYSSLTAAQQADYLDHWKVPDIWKKFYFDPEWQEFLDHVDDVENDVPKK